MQVLIDGYFVLSRSRGIGRYVANLVREIPKLDPTFEFKVAIPQKPKWYIPPEYAIKIPPVPVPLWEQILLPLYAKHLGVKIIHSPGNTGPILLPSGVKLILTLHDMIFRNTRGPGFRGHLVHFYVNSTARIVARKAVKIITVSQSSKIDIQKDFEIPEEKITVIYNGIDDHFFQDNQNNCQIVLERLGIKSKYIFHLGGNAPNKNTIGAIKAFAFLLQDKKYQDLSLVIGGIHSKPNDNITHFIKQNQLEQKIKFLSCVTDEELKCVYSNAELFLFPSLYEGFGLPPLEAMACGTPVVASNLTSVPEVVGEAGILVDPRKPNEIAEAMAHILDDEQLRRKLIQAGKQRVQAFRWEKQVKKTLQVYKMMLEK